MDVPTNAMGRRVGAGSVGVAGIRDIGAASATPPIARLGCGFGLLLGPGFVGEMGASGRWTQSMTAVPSSTRLKKHEMVP